MACKRCGEDRVRDGRCGKCGLIQPKPDRPTHCWKCGHAVEIHENCPECGTLRGDYWEQEVERKREPLSKHYRYYKKDHVWSFYKCDRCRVIMWHHLQYCMGCGGRMQRVKCNHEEMIRDYDDYRRGW